MIKCYNEFVSIVDNYEFIVRYCDNSIVFKVSELYDNNKKLLFVRNFKKWDEFTEFFLEVMDN